MQVELTCLAEIIVWHGDILPGDVGQVIVVAVKDDLRFVCPAWYEGDGRFHSQSGGYLKVVYWAYVPSGPKQSEVAHHYTV